MYRFTISVRPAVSCIHSTTVAPKARKTTQQRQRVALGVVLLFGVLGAVPAQAQLGRTGFNYDPFRTMDLWSNYNDKAAQSWEPRSSENVISVDVLKNPLSGRIMRMMQKARKVSQTGDHAKAISMVRDILEKYPESAPYSRSVLGTEYLFQGDWAQAATELEEAVRLFPHVSANRSNFAIALALLGRFERAEEQVRRALDFEHDSPQANAILGALMKRKELLRLSAVH